MVCGNDAYKKAQAAVEQGADTAIEQGAHQQAPGQGRHSVTSGEGLSGGYTCHIYVGLHSCLHEKKNNLQFLQGALCI